MEDYIRSGKHVERQFGEIDAKAWNEKTASDLRKLADLIEESPDRTAFLGLLFFGDDIGTTKMVAIGTPDELKIMADAIPGRVEKIFIEEFKRFAEQN